MTYITPIYDRTYGDVEYAMLHPEEMSKGAYNYTDLNRVENNTRYVADDMYNRNITREPINLNSKYDWNEQDIPTKEDMNRIINNVLLLQALSVDGLELQSIQAGGQMTYQLANAIEKNLEIMRTQQLPTPDKFYLEVENGTGSGYYSEDTIVNISADMPPENKLFDRWSGDADDLKQIGNVYAAQTTFTMWHKDAKITANYKSGLKHKLIINPKGATGDGEYQEGNIVNIIAADAPNGKVFHHWEGKYVDNLMNVNASTTAFTMPDEDCELTAIYIYPNVHKLTVANGSGSGWYNYKDKVSISATPPSPKHIFSHWSGNVGYLTDANSSITYVTMPDINIKVTAHFTYVPELFTLTVINGSGSGQYYDDESVNVRANEPEEGKGFYKWTSVGPGSFSATLAGRNEWSSYALFYMGEGNTVLTANYAPKHHVTVINGTGSGDLVEGRTYTISANSPEQGQTFSHWEENGEIVSEDIKYSFVMGTSDRTFTAIYKPAYSLLVVDGTGSGTYREGQKVLIRANQPDENYLFAYWEVTEGNLNLYGTNIFSSSATITIAKSDATIQAIFKPKRTLTVNNGITSGTYYEGQKVEIIANSAPEGYRFSKWTGDTSTISNVNAAKTYCVIDSKDMTITAEYELLPDRELTVVNGTGSGTYKNGTTIDIIANEAPDGMTFLTWAGDVEQIENVWASTTKLIGINSDTYITATYFTPENPEEYLLTVINGSFTGNYPAGSEVSISADTPLSGYEFWKWTGDTSTIRDIRSEETTMIMPAYATTITANYKPEGSVDLFTLTVNYGSGSGDYEQGTEVPIKANPPSNGFEFDKWLGDIDGVVNVSSEETTCIIGAKDAIITASYKPTQRYTLTVNGGYGTGPYYEGQKVTIIANKVDNDDVHYTFRKWTGDVDTVENVSEATTIVTILPRDMNITADYLEEWHLVVTNGSGSGYYSTDIDIPISANEPENDDLKFNRWIGDVAILSNIFEPNTLARMKQSSAKVEATYRVKGTDNSIAYYNGVLVDSVNDIPISSIEIVSDVLEVGTIITDKNGNIGICIELTDTYCKTKRIFTVNSYKEVL